MTSKRSLILVVVCMLALSLTASAAIPVGTKVTVRLGQAISSETAHTGDTWDGTLANDIVVNGQTIAKAGDPVKGKVTYAKASGRLKTPGQVSIRVTSINGTSVASSAIGAKGKSHTKSNATKIGGGAAAGALIGALAGGGKGAAIGAGVGAGAGTGVAAATGKQDVTLSAETARTFTITSSK
jgi:hypothetical protein